MRWSLLLLSIILLLASCQNNASQNDFSISDQLSGVSSLSGKKDYLPSPFATAGDQMYLVGHQDGSFPDLGWHVKGEMGGLWQHPIKLSDGFAIEITNARHQSACLDQATEFVNYPIASRHHFILEDLGLEVNRFQFVADKTPGLVVEVQVKNTGVSAFTGTLNFTNRVDLRPVWLGERTNMKDQFDEVVLEKDTWIAKDTGNDWYCVWRSSLSGEEISKATCTPETFGLGLEAGSEYIIELAPGAQKVVQFFMAGSSTSKAEALANLDNLSQNLPRLFSDKREKYENIAATAQLQVPDQDLQTALNWTKYASEWLRFEIPGEGVGIAAGIPDYPWWFGCDQTYSVRGLLGVGMPEMALDIMNTLLQLSEENGNGRIVHEVSTNGVVFNPGNINETPHFISAAWEVFLWTGDEAFLAKAYEQAKAGLEWLAAQDKDGNSYPDGHGMMEIHGMDAEMMDVIAYTFEAYQAAAKMAQFFKEEELANKYAAQANLLQQKINEDWWVADEACFADFRATPQKALELVEGAIVRADTLAKPWSTADLQIAKATIAAQQSTEIGAYAFYHNWVVNTPMETGAADEEKARQALQTGNKYVNPFGMYVTGIDRKKEEENLEAFAALKAKESFNYTGAVMTLPTGVQAVSAARYGEPDLALDYLQRMVRSFSFAHPGSMYEVSPDYGMLVQAWNVYALVRPVVSHFLGIQPEAHLKRFTVQPTMPAAWEKASIKALPVGANTIGVSIDGDQFTINQTLDWEVVFVAPSGKSISRVNGEAVEAGTQEVLLKGKNNLVELVN